MADSKKPGTNVGNKGGIYQEVGPKGGAKPNYATVNCTDIRGYYG